MVNPYTDPRYQMARMMRAQNQAPAPGSAPSALGPAPSSSAVSLGRTAIGLANANPSLRQQIDAIASGSPKAQSKGLIGGIMSNPVTKVAFKGMELLALPGRAVQSTLAEVVDALDNNPKTRFSISDWGKHMKDPTFGFGKAARIHTGDKWLDRVIGFVGDVALDPITYASFGAGHMGSYSGRLKLAARVLENTGDEALSASVARIGRAALRDQPEILDRIGANKFGVYMFGKRLFKASGGLRVPMTGHFAEMAESTLARIRLAITDTRLGEYMQKITMPKNMLEARIALAKGAGDASQLADYVRFFDMLPSQRSATAKALQAFSMKAMETMKQEEAHGGLTAYRATLHKFLENPALLDSASQAERDGFQVWKAWFDEHKANVLASWQSVDPAADIKMRENYFPHVMTDEAIAYTKSNTTHGAELRNIFMEDPFAQPDSFTPRSLVPGKKFFGKVLTENDMTIEALNRIANEGGFVGNFFETDVVNAVNKYVKDAAHEMGIIERNRILRDTNFFKKLEDARVVGHEVDADAVASARAHIDHVNSALEGAGNDFRGALKDLKDAVQSEAAVGATTVAEQQAGVGKLVTYFDTAAQHIDAVDANVRAARDRVMQLFGDPASLDPAVLSDKFPETLRPVLDQFDAISNELATYKALIEKAQNDIATGGAGLVGSDAVLADLEAKAHEVYAKYADAYDSIRSSMEFSNVLQETWDRITDGGRVGGTTEAHDVMRTIRTILSLDAKSARSVANKRAAVMGIEGSLRDFIDANPQFAAVMSQYAGIGGAAAIPASTVRNMTAESFDALMGLLYHPDTNVRRLREGALWAVARDLRTFGEAGLPESLKPHYDALLQALDDANGLDAYYALRRTMYGVSTIDQFNANFGAAMRQGRFMRGQIEDLAFIESSFQQIGGDIANQPLTLDVIQAMGGGDEASRKITHLYNIYDQATANGTEITIGDAMQQVADYRTQLQEAYDAARFSGSGTVITSEGTAGAVKSSYSFDDLIKQHQDIVNLENAKSRVSRRVLEQGMDYNRTKEALSSALVRYQAISDAHVKFEAIANVLAPHGMVPSEDMWRGILRTTYNQYGRQYSEKFSRLVESERVVNELRNAWSKKIQEIAHLPEGQRPSLLSVFQDVYATALEGPDAPILREIVGEQMGSLIDPITLDAQRRTYVSGTRSAADAARAAESKSAGDIALKEARYRAKSMQSKWERDWLIPWARTIDPSLRSDNAAGAMRILRDTLKAGEAKGSGLVISPLSPKSTQDSVAKWFASFFDSARSIDDSFHIVGTSAPGTVVKDGQRIVKGSISRKIQDISEIVRFFSGMNDGFINPHEFFHGIPQDTPSTYAWMMTQHARSLKSILDFGDGSMAAGMDVLGARKVLKRGSVKANLAAVDAEQQATHAQRVVEAFRNPDISSQELRDLGFTEEMMAKREAILKAQDHRATGQYAKALNDEEIIKFLVNSAGMDMSKMEDGIIVHTIRRPVYAESVATADAVSNASKVQKIQESINSLDNEIIQRRREIVGKYFSATQQSKLSAQDQQLLNVFLNMSVDDPRYERALKYIAAKNGNYRREFLRDMQALTEDVRGGVFRSRRAALQRELDAVGLAHATTQESTAASAAAAGTVLRYENVPVFATMPDGSVLKFTKAEWESLYHAPVTAQDLRDLRSEMGRADRALGAARKRAELLKSYREQAGPNIGAAYTARAVMEREYNKALDELAYAEMVSANARIAWHAARSDTKAAALEKVRILLDGHAGQEFKMDPAGLQGFIKDVEASTNGTADHVYGANMEYYRSRSVNPMKPQEFVHPVDSGTRINSLNATWEKSNSYKTLQAQSRLAREAAGGAYGDARRSAKLLRKASNDATAVAERARTEWGTVEKRIADAMHGMRMAEVNAALSAGGELGPRAKATMQQFSTFGWPGGSEEQQIRRMVESGVAIDYTLNGKNYVVPSFEDMYNNPSKYIARGIDKQSSRLAPSKLVDMFNELRKPGNVALWSGVSPEVRSTAAMYELGKTLKDLRGEAVTAKRAASEFRYEIRASADRMGEIKSLMDAWSKDAATLSDALASVRKALAVEQRAAQKELSQVSGQALKDRLDFFDLGEEVKALYGDVDAIPDANVNDFIDTVRSRIEMLQTRQSMFQQVVDSAPDAAASRALLGSVRPETRDRWIGVFRDWIESNRATMRALAEDSRNGGGDARVWNAWLNAHAAEARFIREQARLGAAQADLATLEAGQMVDKVIKPFERGYKRAAKAYLEEANLRVAKDFNMPSYGINVDSAKILSNLARINDGANIRLVGSYLNKYTSFFKAYATLSPGFHVRNALSNFFQMFASGAEIGNLSKGLDLYRSMGRAFEKGLTVEEWIRTLPEAAQAHARIASDVAMALGGGNVDDAFREFSTLKKNVLTDNPMTRASRSLGHRVEGSARFMLAYDSAVAGMDMTESFNRVKRFLFDYNDPTILDDTVRGIIPFWTWMSRNLPLQIVNQWQNPKAYVIYGHLAANFGLGPKDIVPGYMREQGALKLGTNTYLTPDLPFTKLNEQMAEFSNPSRMLSYLNPALRLPMELAGNTKFYNNTQFSNTAVPAGGKYAPLQPLLAALGQLQHNDQGQAMMSDKAQYAINSLIPTLGQADRLFPATDTGDGAATLRYLGIPIRNVNQDAQNRVLDTRTRALQALAAQQKRLNP